VGPEPVRVQAVLLAEAAGFRVEASGDLPLPLCVRAVR
jgi:hypothetical protein